MISFVLFPQASEPGMNFNISNLAIKNHFTHVQRDKRIVVNCHCVDYIIIFE